jgi:hypothetical protein
MTWVQIVGSVAGACLLVWLPIRLMRGGGSTSSRPWLPRVFTGLLVASVLGYLVLLGLRLPDLLNALSSGEPGEAASPQRVRWANLAFTFGAGCVLLACCLPLFVSLADLRWRRILAIARLSFKEAVRRRILYVFCVLIFVLLFLQWFEKSKLENQLQSQVDIVYRTMTPLLLVSAALVASFSLPTDIKQQTIHTVVTKPVERFEIVLGRILGYTGLMTLVLIVMTTLSLFYVLRGVNPEAANESLKARDPVYGTLTFEAVENEYTDQELRRTSEFGVNVGNEWGYHSYITGQAEDRPRGPLMYAVWTFRDVPSALASRDTVRCEFNFDVYRETKGIENQGILCSFFFQTRNFQKTRSNLSRYQSERRRLGGKVELTPAVDNPVSEEFGYFEVQGKSIRNYHTLHVDVPGGLFRNALKATTEEAASGAPALVVRVRCGSQGQMIGAARYSLYLRADGAEGRADPMGFARNYFKASLGLWMRVVLIVTICVCVSTELGGIITFLCVMLLYLGGMSRDYIKDLADRKNPGGGPGESLLRLATRKVTAAQLDQTTLADVVTAGDAVFRGVARVLLQVLPDVSRWDFTENVANGFNIGVISQDLLPALLILLGYLAPWVLLAFYLIRSREIAGAH